MSRKAIAVVIVALLLAGLGAWYYAVAVYPLTLGFEQKLERGYLRAAYREALAEAAADPQGEDLAGLVRVLTLKGNFGRADLLAHSAGIHDDLLELTRDFQVQVLAEAEETGTIVNHFSEGKLSALQGYPAYQNLKFFVGYQQALLGDWNAAKDYFWMAWRDGVSPELKPYLQYYYARALIREGDEREAERGRYLLGKLAMKVPAGLPARVALNQLQAAIAGGQEGFFSNYLSRIARASTSWEYPKALVDLGCYNLAREEPLKAARYFLQALADHPDRYGTKRSTALGLADAMAALDGEFDGLAGDFTSDDGENLLYTWVELLEALKELPRADEPLSQLSSSESATEARFQAMEALSLLYSETKRQEDFEALLLTENLLPAPDGVLQTSYLNFARMLWKQGQTFPARGYFEKATELDGPRQSDALFEYYQLLKERSADLDKAKAIELLEGVIADAASDHRIKACEELIALAVLTDRDTLAQRTVSTVAGLAPEVARFWRIALADKADDNETAALERESTFVRNFSYYELQALGALTRDRIETDNMAFYLQDENAAEYLAGAFLHDLVLSVSSVADYSELPPLLAAICLRNSELTRNTKAASWMATGLLEDGPVFDEALTDYVLSVAYPTPYIQEVQAAAGRYNVDSALIYAVMKKESNFDPDATSSAGAVGLMQLMPDTASSFNRFLPEELRGRGLTDPERNIHLGAAYLSSLQTAYWRDHLVLSAYNGGPGNLNRWLQLVGTADPVLFVELIPNSENEQFVKKTLKYAAVYRLILQSK